MVIKNIKGKGFIFKTYQVENRSPFENLLEIFKELTLHTSVDFDEAIDWLCQKRFKKISLTLVAFFLIIICKVFNTKQTTFSASSQCITSSWFSEDRFL